MPRILGARPENRRYRSIGANYYALGVDDQSLPCPSGSSLCPPFLASVEAWRDDVTMQAGTIPVDFLLAWIMVESAGNPCSWTNYGGGEGGIWQLMANDNLTNAGTTMAQQHPVPPCTSGAQTTAGRASLTDDQAYEQVRAGIQYVNYCRSRVDAWLAMYGYTDQPGWSDSDWSYWALVKQVHAAPAYIPTLLAAGVAGGSVPADFDAMMTFSPSYNTSNARRVGVFGEGGGSYATAALSLLSGDNKFIVIAALGVGLLYLLHKNR